MGLTHRVMDLCLMVNSLLLHTYMHTHNLIVVASVNARFISKMTDNKASNAILINNSTKAISLLRGMHIMQSYVQRREFTQSSGFDSAA